MENSRTAGASMLSPLMGAKKIFLTENVSKTTSGESIPTRQKVSSPNTSKNPSLVLAGTGIEVLGLKLQMIPRVLAGTTTRACR